MTKTSLTRVGIVVMLTWTSSFADPGKQASKPGCPGPVLAAVERAFARSTISSCKTEREHGREQLEVKVVKADGAKVEVDVSPDGELLQTEETIALDQVPAAVMKAFAAKYAQAKVTTAEKQTPASGAPSYELGFATAKRRRAATFQQDGTFVAEE